MTRIGYHASHQQFPPSALLHLLRRAAGAGFRAPCAPIASLRWWAGETVTHSGLLQVEEAKLYSPPSTPPRIVGAALSAETAAWMGEWADGLITTVRDRPTMRAVVEAFRHGGGDDKPVYLQAQLAFAKTDAAALQEAWEQWCAPMIASEALPELSTPAQFAAASVALTPAEIDERLRVSADPERHLHWPQEDVELGFAEINLHNVCRSEQERFIEVFGERVAPRLRGVSRGSRQWVAGLG